MKVRTSLSRKIIWPLLIGLVLSVQVLKSQNTAAPGGPANGIKLSGSYLKPDDAVSKSDVIFVGQVTDVGTEVTLPATPPSQGPLYSGVKVNVTQVLHGSVKMQTAVALYVVTASHEVLHQVGSSYIFFVQTNFEKWSDYPFNALESDDAHSIAIKLLPATDDTIAQVKELIATSRF